MTDSGQPSDPNKLTLEQEFELRSFANTVRQMSRQQAQDFLIEFREHMMHRENMYKHFLKQNWGV